MIRCRGTNEPGKLSLGKTSGGPQFANLAGNLLFRARLFKLIQPGLPARIEAAVKDMSSLLVSVPGGTYLKQLLALQGALDLLRRDRPFFHETARRPLLRSSRGRSTDPPSDMRE
jgi:hypothetical protein